jgi:DNA-binding CsgD family transcriptional regulator
MRDTAKLQTLTRRQHEIAALVAEGLSNKEIAWPLKITEGTVKLHLHAIYSKLEVPNRTALAVLVGNALLERAATQATATHPASPGLCLKQTQQQRITESDASWSF